MLNRSCLTHWTTIRQYKRNQKHFMAISWPSRHPSGEQSTTSNSSTGQANMMMVLLTRILSSQSICLLLLIANSSQNQVQISSHLKNNQRHLWPPYTITVLPKNLKLQRLSQIFTNNSTTIVSKQIARDSLTSSSDLILRNKSSIACALLSTWKTRDNSLKMQLFGSMQMLQQTDVNSVLRTDYTTLFK